MSDTAAPAANGCILPHFKMIGRSESIAARPASDRIAASRIPVLVRITHWTTVASSVGLLISGIGILLAHPRFYWGETGGLGSASILDLPLPFMIGGPSGWGRYLHFLSAWVCIPTGIVYGTFSVLTRRFRGLSQNHPPARHSDVDYTPIQRLTYLVVVFLLFPLMIWTGFAMSPALTAVSPLLVTVLGGQQSARTIHFVLSIVLVVFVIGHITMVSLTGFASHMRRMLW